MRYLVVPVLLLCAACSSVSPVQVVQPDFYTRSPWLVEGRFNHVTRGIKILVDGEPVLAGVLAWRNDSVVMAGSYMGAKISAHCADYIQEAKGRIGCSVAVNGETAALLSFL